MNYHTFIFTDEDKEDLEQIFAGTRFEERFKNSCIPPNVTYFYYNNFPITGELTKDYWHFAPYYYNT